MSIFKLDGSYKKKLVYKDRFLDTLGGVLLIASPVVLLTGIILLLVGLSIAAWIFFIMSVVYTCITLGIYRYIKQKLLNIELLEHLKANTTQVLVATESDGPVYVWPAVEKSREEQ